MYLEGLTDFTGDSRPDAYGYQLQPNGSFQNVVILPNDGTGQFGNPIIVNTTLPISNDVGYSNQKFYGGLKVADLNGDGFKDFVVHAATAPAAVYTLLNNGSNSFAQQGLTVLSDRERIADVADINGDGRGDLITTITHVSGISTGVLNGVYYRIGGTDGNFGTAVSILNSNSVAIVTADLDNDTRPDIAVSYYWSVNEGGDNFFHLRILKNLGMGVFAIGPNSIINAYISIIDDFNNDNRPDLAGFGGTSGLVVLRNEGSNQFSLSNHQVLDHLYGIRFAAQLFSVDYNNDGNKDLIDIQDFRADYSAGRRVRRYSVFVGNGAGTFTRTDVFRPFQGFPVNVDADPAIESVDFANATNGIPRPSVTNHTVVSTRNVSCMPIVSGQTKIADFDGDGASDMVLWRPSTGRWRYLSTNADATFGWGLGSLGDIPVMGDFDGDGRTDAAVYRNNSGVWWIRNTANGGAIGYAFGLSGDIPVPADYNGDGRTDIAVFRPSSGTWYVQFSGSGQFYAVNFGLSGDRPVQQDYDGDGKADVAVFRPSNGTWYYLRSSDGGFFAMNWGLGSDIAVSGDYDSDGKADITVFRPSNGTWYILQSFDGGFTALQFGQNGDLPFQVDSNGDGVVEIGVRRVSTGTFFASAQTSGYTWGAYDFGDSTVRFMLPN